MALSRTDHINALGTATGGVPASFTSASFTPPSNSLLVAIVGIVNDQSLGTGGVSGGGLTWTKRCSITSSTYFGYQARLEIWTAPVTTGASMTLTATDSVNSGSDPARIQLQCVSFTGYDTTTPTGAKAASSEATDGSVTITLDAATASTSHVIGARYWLSQGSGNALANPGTTPGTYAEIYEGPSSNGYGALQSEVRTASTATGFHWADVMTISDTGWFCGCAALEIKEAGAGSNDATGALGSVAASMTGAVNPTPAFSGALGSGAASMSGGVNPIPAFSGALGSGSASMSGAISAIISTAGSLGSGAATMAGTVTVAEQIVSGALGSGPAAMTGAVSPIVAASGALGVGSSSMAGAISAIIGVAGALGSGAASIAGTITTGTPVSGALGSGAATMTGAVSPRVDVSGNLGAGSAVFAAAIGITVGVSGALASGRATMSGTLPSGLQPFLVEVCLQASSAQVDLAWRVRTLGRETELVYVGNNRRPYIIARRR